MNEEQLYLNFDEYIRASEPHKRERVEAWHMAIGLQAIDGLQVSEYLKQTTGTTSYQTVFYIVKF